MKFSLRRRINLLFAVTFFWATALLGAGVPGRAQAASGAQVPGPLQPWVGWAMAGEEQLACPWSPDGRVCVWPGRLEVRTDATGAIFSMQVWLDAPGEARLVGDDARWPQAVRVNGQPAPVVEREQFPAVLLEAGAHTISGEFSWDVLPQMLQIPPQVGQVSLQVGGKAVARPQLDAQSRLWLRAQDTPGAGSEADSIRASVYRRIMDGSPVEIATELELNVSGKPRKVDLGRVLVEGSRPTRVSGALAVEFGADGRVSAYVRPGTHSVTLTAVIEADVRAISAPRPGPGFYDPQEVWVWVPDEATRLVELSGLRAVDPARTSLPAQWHGHTTFLAEPGATLTLEVTRRGVVGAPNAIRLHRRIWLDTDGGGLSMSDKLRGTLSSQWRLDYAGEATLGHVQQIGDARGVLITENPQNGRRGVELRQKDLDIQADLRQEAASAELLAVGWDQDVQQLSADLYLPPGWVLFGAQGVDRVSRTWLNSWTLWDFFFVLIVAMSIAKLLGRRWAPLAAVALVLSHGHGGAPMWVWIHLIASLALLRALPEGWWRKGVFLWRAGALLVLFGGLANFAHDQIRAGLHPQIDRNAFWASGSHSSGFNGFPDAEFEAPTQATVADEAEADAMVSSNSEGSYRAPKLPTTVEKKSSYDGYLDLKQIDPKAVVQTGPGLPTWSWNHWTLRWSGPVSKDHRMQLWLVGPAVNRALAFVRVACLLVLALLLLVAAGGRWRKPEDGAPEPENGPKRRGRGLFRPLFHAVLMLASVGVLVGSAAPARAQQAAASSAQIPSMELLAELRRRLTDVPLCDGECVVASRADFEVDGSRVKMRAEVSAERDATWHLPGPLDVLHVESVRLDHKPTDQVRRDADGMLQVRVPAGRHIIEMSANLGANNLVTVQFNEGTRPKFVTFSGEGWSVDGLSPQGVPENSLLWTRHENSVGAEAEAGARDGAERDGLPPWYRVERHFQLGLPWQVQTTIIREHDIHPQLVQIPLLAGEKVLREGLQVKNGKVLVNFERGAQVVSYTSELPIQPRIELTAPSGEPWSERWIVTCSRIWNCEFSGVPPVELVGPAGPIETRRGQEPTVSQPRWEPWPGESLSIEVNRPAGAQGQSSTVESVSYKVTPGQRLMEAKLSLKIRASQGGWQAVTLPKEAKLQGTKIDAESRGLRLEDGTLNLPVRPGSHTYVISWQQPWERGFIERVPQVDIGGEAANVEVTIRRDGERWLLRAMGPAWGPAVLFWSHLVALLIIALLLSRMRGLPLKPYEWALLLMGLSQLPYLALLPIVGWFVALRLREHHALPAWWQFNLVQLALLGISLVAAATLYFAIHVNLLVDIDMQVQGARSSNGLLRWYVDRSGSALPTPAIISVPVWVWRVLMLGWALWLASRLLGWIPWGWRAFSRAGLWRKRPPRAPKSAASDAQTADAAQPDGEISPDKEIRPK